MSALTTADRVLEFLADGTQRRYGEILAELGGVVRVWELSSTLRSLQASGSIKSAGPGAYQRAAPGGGGR